MSKSSTNQTAAVATATVAPVANPLDKFPTDAKLQKDGYDNLSKRIRRLSALGATTGQIAKIVRRSNGEHPKYQHVRNVLITPVAGPKPAVVPNEVVPAK